MKQSTLRTWTLWLVCVLVSPLWMGSACMVQRPKVSAKASYGQNAKQFYEYAQKLLKAGNHEQALKEFQKLKTKYPFSSYATLAEVGIADTQFESGKYLLAIDAYKLFVKLHPTHPQAGYAAYQAAFSYDKLRPWDWFLVPPSYEKDTSIISQSIKAYQEYLQEYPTHKNAPLAKKAMNQCLEIMGKHEMSVANYYKRRGQSQAVVWRMEHLLKTYPGVGLDAEARYLRAEALMQLKQYKEAKIAIQEIQQKHPKERYAQWSQNLLAQIPQSTPTPRQQPAPSIQKATSTLPPSKLPLSTASPSPSRPPENRPLPRL